MSGGSGWNEDSKKPTYVPLNVPIVESSSIRSPYYASRPPQFSSPWIIVRRVVLFAVLIFAAVWLGPRLAPEFWHQMAQSEYQQGNFLQAAAYDSKGLRWSITNETKAHQLMWRGYDYLWAKDNARALADFDESIRLNPAIHDHDDSTTDLYWEVQPPCAYKGQFWANFESKQYGVALQECNRLIELNPAYVENYGIRAKCYRGLGNYTAAQSGFRFVIARKPGLLFPYFHLSDMQCKNLHDPNAAIATLQLAVQNNPSTADAWGMLKWGQFKAGQLAQATTSNLKALALSDSPNEDYVRCNLGLIYAIQGNWAAAQPVYATAVRHAFPPTLQGALQDIHKYIKLHPNSPALQQALKLVGSSPAAQGGTSDDQDD